MNILFQSPEFINPHAYFVFPTLYRDVLDNSTTVEVIPSGRLDIEVNKGEDAIEFTINNNSIEYIIRDTVDIIFTISLYEPVTNQSVTLGRWNISSHQAEEMEGFPYRLDFKLN